MTQHPRSLAAIAATALLTVVSSVSAAAPHTDPAAATAASAVVADDGAPTLEVGDTLTSTVAEPTPFDVQVRRPGRARGDLFITPQALVASHPQGPVITDDQGRPVWFHQIPDGYVATDFRVQEYRGEKVLTWWEGKTSNTGIGGGTGYIADENYEIIATVQTPDAGEVMDMHEFQLTDEGTALIISYRESTADLRPVGGAADGKVIDNVVQEIDIATGETLLTWSALDRVPLQDSDILPDTVRPYDFLHVNSVGVDTDGNLLISANSASTVYKVDRKTGDVIWRLGGHNSDFRLGVGARFMWQHDVRAVGKNTYMLFDNANRGSGGAVGYESRVAWIRIDPVRERAELVRQLVHPEEVSSALEGGAQSLRDGNTVVSWGKAGRQGRISEFDRRGELVFDALLPKGDSSYRAYRHEWDGMPLTKPELLVGDADSDTVRASWNGASEVARWRLLAGASESDLKPVATAAWDGFETPLTLPAGARDATRLKVQALDARGKVIGTSAVTPAAGDSSGNN